LVVAGAVSGYSWDLFRQITQRSGIQISVFHRPPDRERIRKNFAHESFEGGNSLSFDSTQMTLSELRRFMDVAHADAVLLFGTMSKLPIAEVLFRRPRRCPVVFAADTNIDRIFPAGARDWARLMLYRAISHQITEAWALGLSNEHAFRLLGFRKLRTLPFYSVTFDELGPPMHDLGPERTNPVRLLAIGRLAPEKNFEALVQAVAHPSLRSRVTLTIVGDGPSRPKLQESLQSSPTRNVRLAGAVTHARLGPFFREANALVIPSRLEPWGNVVTEALGMGIPVLATPAVGAAASTAGRYIGVQITRGHDAGALTEAILRFVDDLPLLARGAVTQADRARSEFDVTNVADRMIEAIADLRASQPGVRHPEAPGQGTSTRAGTRVAQEREATS
jgi:glycosyltransferase involved in cell wall biosynthesis